MTGFVLPLQHGVTDNGAMAKVLRSSLRPGAAEALAPTVPIELQQLLRTHPDIDGAVIFEAIPERKVRFDDIPGEPRNADLVCLAERANELIAISIEAKADETFGELVADVLRTPPAFAAARTR